MNEDYFFVTVGGQLPFDRLIHLVDELAGERKEWKFFAQIGESKYRPRHMEFVEKLTPNEFKGKLKGAKAVVAHAGMGTILLSLQEGKRIIVLSRRSKYKETRNDHQLHTAIRLKDIGYVEVVEDKNGLERKLEEENNGSRWVRSVAGKELIKSLDECIFSQNKSKKDR